MLVAVSIHIVFFWVLGLTMQAKTVDNIDDKPKIEEVKENPDANN